MVSQPLHLRPARAIGRAAAAAALVWIAACTDGERIVGNSGDDGGQGPDSGAIVSDPSPLIASGDAGERPLRLAATEQVYVSLIPGTVPDGGVATILNTRTRQVVTVGMSDGGFDPVPIDAVTGDLIEVTIARSGGGSVIYSIKVPRARRPRVVRTVPARRKRDVALNATITVVFSEPILPGTTTGIQLLRGGDPVPGQVTVSPDGIRAELNPAQHLEPNTDYVLAVSEQVTDRSGASLAEPVRVEFTTGTSVIVASVVTDPVAMFRTNAGSARTFGVQATRDDEGGVDGSFHIYYPDAGWRVFGRVTCFTIRDGNKVWMAGVIESSSNPEAVNLDAKWRAIDHGPPGLGAVDELSFVYPGDWDGTFGTNEEFCANTPTASTTGEEMLLLPIESGNIIVNAAGASTTTPTSLAELVYAAWPDGGLQIINADGSGGRLLTGQRGDWNPSWSPDGSWIAFDRRENTWGAGDIYVIRSDGSGLRQLTSGSWNDLEPEWSPDGSRIAFAREGGIYIMDALDGGNMVRVSASGDGHPTWSPDGQRIAFMSWRSGSHDIYVMNADGSGVRRLTSGGDDWFPRWSPDGRWIAFERNRSGVLSLYLVAPEGGSAAVQLAPGGRTPSWSRDGQRILYEYYGMTEINVDGSGMMFLGPGFDPAWSPVGTLPTRPVPYVTVAKAGGDAQTGRIGTTLPIPLSVRVSDRFDVPVANVSVHWFLLFAGEPEQPSLSAHMVKTDANGIASVQLTLGSSYGPVTVRAAVRDGTALNSGVEFTATVLDPGGP